MMHYVINIIIISTILWCIGVGVLHVTPNFRNKWDNWIHKNNTMHLSIGIFVFFVALINVFLFFLK